MFRFIRRKNKTKKVMAKNKHLTLFNEDFAKAKIKKNHRTSKGKLFGHKTYYDKSRGIVIIDEIRIKKQLSKRFNKVFA